MSIFHSPFGWTQLVLFSGILLALTKPMGVYLTRVLDPKGKTFLDPVLRPVEIFLYRIFGVKPETEQAWQEYTLSLLLFSLIGLVMTYGILRLQHLFPLNPQGFGPLSEHLAFNTAVSFTTNTNWQSYGGESTMSYLSQMVGLAFHNFRLCSRRYRCSGSLGEGHCPAHGENHRQLLGGYCTHTSLPPSPDLPCLCRVPRVSGGDSEFQALTSRHALWSRR